MAIYKNKASQKLAVLAWDTSADAAKTGDAAQITAEISKDGGASAASDDTNPTELDATDHPGIYLFDLTQAETNADLICFSAVSSTANVRLEPLMIYTEPEIREADAVSISGDSTAADNLELACDNYSATRGLAGTALPAAVADAEGGLPISDAGGLDLDTFLARLDAAISTRSTLAAGAEMALTSTAQNTLVAAVEAEIADDATGEAVKQAIIDKLIENLPDLDDLTLAAIASAVATAILTTPANKLVTNASGQVEASNMRGTDDANTTTPPTAAAIADQVWNEAIADHNSAGTFGAKNQKAVPSESAADYKADVSALALQATLSAAKTILDALPNDGALTDIATAITFAKNVLEADVTIDTSTTPWQLVYKNKTTAAELIRKSLKDKDGTDITDIDTVIGQQVEVE